MLGMNEEALINPARDTNEPELPESGILVINPGEADRFHKAAEKSGSAWLRKGNQL
jgi:hypothetical protein